MANKTRNNTSFTDSQVEAVWQKATPVNGNPRTRKDSCGAIMYRHLYGQTIDYGWEVDHKIPVSRGGSDELSNLQPLQWENNRFKGDNYPNWSCKITSR